MDGRTRMLIPIRSEYVEDWERFLTIITQLVLVQNSAHTLVGNICDPDAFNSLTSFLQRSVQVLP